VRRKESGSSGRAKRGEAGDDNFDFHVQFIGHKQVGQ
jgi:hypothetical protein